MIRLVSHIMLLALITHLFYSSGFLLDYYVNMDVYKANCVNQDRPELNCDGKCILAQKIAEAQNNQVPDQDKMTIPASMEYLSSVFFMDFTLTVQPSSSASQWYSNYSYEPLYKTFQPPRI